MTGRWFEVFRWSIAAGAVLISVGCDEAPRSEGVFPDAKWDRLSEKEQKVIDQKLGKARAYSETLGSTSVMIVKKGVAVAEWGDTARVSNLHSIRKSILSALVGISVERGKMDLNKTLQELQIDDNEPSLSTVEKTATVHDLLKARSGVYHPALYETESMKQRRPARGSHAPGTFWYYNNWDFNALGTIFEQETGETIFDAFDKEIARPIQMQDFSPAHGSYVRGADSIHPAYPIEMSARDLARFALLFLNEGRWKERQIIPKKWVADSVCPYSATDTGGYGYMWWTNDSPDKSAELAGSYYAAGAGGQSAYIVPTRDLIVIHRVDTRITDKRVSAKQITELVQMIEAALGN